MFKREEKKLCTLVLSILYYGGVGGGEGGCILGTHVQRTVSSRVGSLGSSQRSRCPPGTRGTTVFPVGSPEEGRVRVGLSVGSEGSVQQRCSEGRVEILRSEQRTDEKGLRGQRRGLLS